MRDKIGYIIIGMMIGLATASIIFMFASVDRSYMETKAIQSGCGEYNSVTSEFQWVDKRGL